MEEKESFVQVREKIARLAAEFVEDGNSIFINTGRTPLAMLKYLKGKHVCVYTNNANVLNEKIPSFVSVYLLGGELRYQKGVITGCFAMNNLENLEVDHCFFGCGGLEPKAGMTTEIPNEAYINTQMVHHTKGNVYVLADYSKIGKTEGFVSCPIDSIAAIVTDTKMKQSMFWSFREKGIEIYQVEE